MIKISQKPTYTAPVNVDLPSDKGQVNKIVFTAQFRRVSQDEVEKIHERIAEGTINDAKLVSEVLVGWGTDVQDDDGNPLEFNDENRAALLNIYPVKPSIVKAFFASLSGAKAKN